jgi:hypothetical protein
MFASLELDTIEIERLKTNNAKNMSHMFYQSSAKNLDFSYIDTICHICLNHVNQYQI